VGRASDRIAGLTVCRASGRIAGLTVGRASDRLACPTVCRASDKIAGLTVVRASYKLAGLTELLFCYFRLFFFSKLLGSAIFACSRDVAQTYSMLTKEKQIYCTVECSRSGTEDHFEIFCNCFLIMGKQEQELWINVR